ncbi:Putative amidase AmiD [Microbacterium sp. Bi98]|nr:amidase [Microbacterium sp. Root280D1]CAH0146047.1 Putative amidase AmiD [Microbacterium sp. Bi98]
MDHSTFTVVEADIAQLHAALETGIVSSVELVARYLNRIAFYDRSGIRLNSVPVLNPAAFDEARESDIRRARGESRGVLDGIPFTAKDSFAVSGLTVASGSPAFADLVASEDAFAVARLRVAGAVLLGLTNMPPMAAGGMQRGVYGRAESPYNGDYLTSAFGSGSSNGSGTATAASLAAFGLGEETWSSGRAPASNNALVAYTPSRGVISVRGNWPLVPTMDVVVPHTRTVADMKIVLDAVVADDADAHGDLWRTQPWIPLPQPSALRPESFAELDDLSLAGLRFAVPRIYINGDGASSFPIETRESVMALWAHLRDDLESAGAEVVETAFPAVDNYEKLHAQDRDLVERGFVTPQFLQDEVGALAIWAMDTFLRQNGDPALERLADAQASQIFPHPREALQDRYGILPFDIAYDIGDYVAVAAEREPDWRRIPGLEAGLRGLEHARRVDLEEWMDAENLDAVIFPTAADVGPADADVNPRSADIAWRNGVWVSNGNLVPRHLGIPTFTVPMGIMSDTRMPVGATIAGRGHDDVRLLQIASAVEALRVRRAAPVRTPALANEALFRTAVPTADGSIAVQIDTVTLDATPGGDGLVRFTATVTGGTLDECAASVDGIPVPTTTDGERITGELFVPADAYEPRHSEWRPGYGPLVVVIVRNADGATAGHTATTTATPF